VIAALQTPAEDPFAPDQPAAYRRWRDAKLAAFPRRIEDVMVPVGDPRALRPGETGAIRRICNGSNLAIYASPLAGLADKAIARRLGEQLGLGPPLANLLADEDAITSIEAAPGKAARGYIPYTNRRLLWHTDGYYNAPGEPVCSFILHCVRPAASGGETRLLDPEIAYILLRDADPEFARALSKANALTIPANEEAADTERPVRTGPVFSVQARALHMRYTARVKSIEWAADETTRAAVRFLAGTLESDSPWVLRLRLEGGQGLVCNNVLHSRSAFEDPPAPVAGRLVYRARYARRVA
jgi:alpha-ketoglutarate-dependent taurine dioxygenase